MRSELAEPVSPHMADFAELLFDDPSTGILLVDDAGWVWRCNAAALRMTAQPRRLVEGWPAFMLVAEPDRDRLKSLCRGVADGNLVARLHATGLPVRIEHVPTSLPDGRPGGRILRMRESQADRSDDPRRLDSQKLQAIGQLTAAVAHDFSNIVSATLAVADMLADSPACGADPGCRELLDDLRKSGERGRSLIRRVLGIARPVSDDIRNVAVDAAIADLADMLRRLFPAAIGLHLDLREAHASVRIDPTRLDQVLLNLAINARDAMPEGGTLSIRSRGVAVGKGDAAPHVREGDYVLVEVADTGIGIPPEVLPRIFDPFFTTRHEHGGTGLGLATVRDIVAEAGGFLDVRSRVGRGTTMLVYLPRAAAAQESRATRRSPAPQASHPAWRGTVLLIEDEPIVRKLAERALAGLGWRVLAAESGEAALALIEGVYAGASRPTVVVSDVALGDMSGFALVRAARDRLAAPHLPAVLTSGFAEGRLSEDIASLGPATCFLAKPYSLPELGAALDRFAHGPGHIAIGSANVKTEVDEHILNESAVSAPSSVAATLLDVTDSGGGA